MTERQLLRKIETLERRVARLEQRVQKGRGRAAASKPTARRKPVGNAWAQDLYDLFAPVRADAAQFSEAEVNADIDEAVTAVRGNRVSRRA